MARSDGTVYINTLVDTKGFGKGMNGIKSQMGGLSGAVGKLGIAIAAAFSVKALINFSKEAIKLGSDLQEVQNVVDVTFTTMSEDVNEFAKGAAEAAGLSETMAKRYMGTFGAMSKAFGFMEDEAFSMSATLTQAVGDVASFYNLTQDEAYTKLKSVFTGETESLKDLGVVMTQSALDAYAMAEGYGKTTKYMSEQEKVALRYAFVLDQLSASQGDFVRTSDSWANQTRILSLNFDSFKANIGQALINIFTPFLKVINQIVAKMAQLSQHFVAFSEMLVGKSTSGGGGSPGDALAEIESGYEDIADATDKATKAQKKYTTGLDEIRSFQDSNNQSSGGIGGIVNPDETKKVNENIEKTESLIDRMINKLTQLIKNEDWEGLGSCISDGLVTALDLFSKKLKKFDWQGLGEDIGEFLKGIKWTRILDSVGKLIWEGINGGIKFWKGMFDAAPIETAILTAIIASIPSNIHLGKKIVITGLLFSIGFSFSKWFAQEIIEWANEKHHWEVPQEVIDSFFENFNLSDLFSKQSIEYGTSFFGGAETFIAIVFGKKVDLDKAFEKLLKETIIPWFSPKKWFDISAGINIGILSRWSEFQKKWKDSMKSWFERDVKPWFTREKWETAMTGMKQAFSNIWNSIKSTTSSVWSYMITSIKNSINNIIYAINAMIGGIVNGINSIIGSLNSIKFTLPDWFKYVAGASAFAGQSFGLNLNYVNAKYIPYLASGAVIPPNAPFMAVLGDQKHGTNIEAPLDTIKQAVREVVGNGSGGYYAFTAQINRRTLFEEMIDEAKLRQSTSGRNPFELA